MRVAPLITCYNDLIFPEVGRAIVRLLRRLGHDVEFPAEQTCCGQMHVNSGYQDACIPLVPVVAELAADNGADAGLAERVAAVSPRVLELTEFLVDVLGVTDVGAHFPHTAAFHPTCHSTRLLGVGARPSYDASS